MSALAITGHRPEKISDIDDVQANLYLGIKAISPEILIQGMASGVDLWSARIAHVASIDYWCVRPWQGHKPRVSDKNDYEMAMKYAAFTVAVNPSVNYPGAWVYQKRNEWMVDRADTVFAIWDGSPGGTANCVKYAVKQEKRILLYDPVTRELDWYRL
jgi:uncharacterized phage-like protein YoqJ